MKRVFILIALISLIGCSSARENLVKISESDLKNIEAIADASGNLLKAWPMYSGMIKGALHGKMGEFPKDALEAIRKLDLLAREYGNIEGLSKEDLGYSLGLRISLLGSTIKVAIQRYQPDLLEYLPLLFIN